MARHARVFEPSGRAEYRVVTAIRLRRAP